MTNPVVMLRGDMVEMWCPGCHFIHYVDEKWDFSGDVYVPTISPSILVRWQFTGQEEQRCHSFIRQGQWEFLGDCTHDLVGQTVPLVPVTEWPSL